MNDISGKVCIPCSKGSQKLNIQQAEEFLKQTPSWTLIEQGNKLHKSFLFKNFADSLAFANKIGEVAEKLGHHPDIAFGHGYLTCHISTHKINGLHENDFILANNIDKIIV